MENGFNPLLVSKGPIAARATTQRLAAEVGLFSFIVGVVNAIDALEQLYLPQRIPRPIGGGRQYYI